MSSKKQSELTSADYFEIARFMTDQTGVIIKPYHAPEILRNSPQARNLFAKYGGDDTAVCDELADSIARYFLGCDWPTFGDKANMEDFINRLRNQAKVMGYTFADES